MDSFSLRIGVSPLFSFRTSSDNLLSTNLANKVPERSKTYQISVRFSHRSSGMVALTSLGFRLRFRLRTSCSGGRVASAGEPRKKASAQAGRTAGPESCLRSEIEERDNKRLTLRSFLSDPQTMKVPGTKSSFQFFRGARTSPHSNRVHRDLWSCVMIRLATLRCAAEGI